MKTKQDNLSTKKTNVVVSSGQYETAAEIIEIRHMTERGLFRRMRQLSAQHAVYGDNHAGWLAARVAIASPADVWGDNSIIGGQWCDPAAGWLDLNA